MKNFYLKYLHKYLNIQVEFMFEGINYVVLDDKKNLVEVSDTKVSESVIIPSNVKFENEFYKVISVGKNAFNWCTELTEIILPYTLEKVKCQAFANCENLKRIQFNSLIPPKMGRDVFMNSSEFEIAISELNYGQYNDFLTQYSNKSLYNTHLNESIYKSKKLVINI